ncbi:Enoyl-CoA hydratase/carnithine racemase [Tistlia consotensis]|uniref:Enoyl-CoA hydratase/carnithine racemase n=1 Tax=Tistlia consotensis USBA 355 TaxID=560819 RepID=A0A1Y6BDX0_9PROT|nr:enoyl-CoA hydratase [Tistlia consotensis]SME96571.1 Enoyl-CoA hydratase/carnithine racemase [Tistlia consotensis USBA 355]SNR55896.1 Enoyl-CoA hydratase/carnithine racemase [Tistlia consotensis]
MAGDTTRIVTALREREGGRVATVTVDNPARLNSLDSAAMHRFAAAFDALGADPELRAVVLTGAGEKAFIAGADIREMAAICDPQAARSFIGALQDCCRAIRQLPVPVIARLRGYAFGGGLEIAAACDLRVAGESCVLGMPEVRLGIPSVIEAALLPLLIGWGRTRELLLFGETLDAARAADWGLLDRVVPDTALDAEVERLLDSLTASPPGAIRIQKRLIRDWEDLPVSAAIEAGVEAFAEAFETDEPRAAMARHLAARAALKTSVS